MFHDGRNPAFQQTIPHGMVNFVSLPKVIIFGVSPGSPRVVSQEGLRSPPEGISGGCLGAL